MGVGAGYVGGGRGEWVQNSPFPFGYRCCAGDLGRWPSTAGLYGGSVARLCLLCRSGATAGAEGPGWWCPSTSPRSAPSGSGAGALSGAFPGKVDSFGMETFSGGCRIGVGVHQNNSGAIIFVIAFGYRMNGGVYGHPGNRTLGGNYRLRGSGAGNPDDYFSQSAGYPCWSGINYRIRVYDEKLRSGNWKSNKKTARPGGMECRKLIFGGYPA